MQREKNASSVLVVSQSAKGHEYICDLLPQASFYPIEYAPNAGEAKRLLMRRPFDIVVINTPLPDESGIELALDLSKDDSIGILLMVKNDLYEQVSYKVEDEGIFTVGKPGTKQGVYQAIKLLVASRARTMRAEIKAAGLKSKMEEIRLVNRAKWLLIDHLKMNESEAHRYIEKQSMDTRISRRDIAESIIRTYEN